MQPDTYLVDLTTQTHTYTDRGNLDSVVSECVCVCASVCCCTGMGVPGPVVWPLCASAAVVSSRQASWR